jgi:2-C-methyl-D-erythritol 4-phosphate cytidylyltransferase
VSKRPQKKESIGVVIVAAGSSRRMNGEDKIMALLAGKPVLIHVLEPFLKFHQVQRIVLMLNRRNISATRELLTRYGWDERVVTCLGGKRRQDSVLAGLKKLGKCDWVIIQDGARPRITADLIKRGLEAAQETGAAIAAIPATDTIKLAGTDMVVRWTMPRDSLWQIQTPQIFRYEMLMNAFQYNEHDVTDEAQLVELTGGRVKLFMGAYDNIKITTPADLKIVGALLRKRKVKGELRDWF